MVGLGTISVFVLQNEASYGEKAKDPNEFCTTFWELPRPVLPS